MDGWHGMTRSILDDPFWRTRDQGTLIAAAWKYGLEHQATLDRTYNHIVDPLWRSSDRQRIGIQPAAYYVDLSYTLTGEEGLPHPHFLHFIHGSVGAVGWKNWDDAAALRPTA
jgi:hypothetical protein